MKLTAKLLAGVAALGFSTMAHAEIDTDALIAQLQEQGFTRIEVKIGLTQVKVEAIRGMEKFEVIYDEETGAVLKQEIEAVEAGDDTAAGVEVRRRLRDFVDADDDDDSDGRGRGRGRGGDDDDDDHDDDDDDDRSGRSDDDDHDEDRDDDRSGRDDDDDDRDEDEDDDEDDDDDDDEDEDEDDDD